MLILNMTAKEIRSTFFEFFKSKNHIIVPSAPMVVKNDPTLMFTNAGMNQFKEWFLGNTRPKYKRVADTQKCLRVSGKHNDLEEVGHDSYHHTMFEMLGNWSFGDYFKTEAIDWAWELLTQVYKIDPSNLYATIFEGSPEENIGQDTEAKNAWLKHLPEDRIILGNRKDNFWEMGDTGPCGPCSEIHIDLRDEDEKKKVPGAELVNKGHHLVIEIWNLVFMQYNRKASGELEPLPEKHVDTGMGLERLCMILQGKKSNYDTDLFGSLISSVSGLCGIKYGENEKADIAMRVISDHIRAIAFSIADGQLPSNVKAGYVIRRILRRAVRYGYTFLGLNSAFLYKLVSVLADEMGDVFPEIVKQQQLIERVIKEEEDAFLRTLDKGIKLIESLISKSGAKTISGEEAFTLYDTFGFPIDLTELIAKEHGFTVDLPAFEIELGKQKERSRNASAKKEGDWVILEDSSEPSFIGYDSTECNARIVKYRSVKAKNNEFYQIVLDRSPFYAESGGQVGDSGYLEDCNGNRTEIINTVKENNLNIHICEKLPENMDSEFKAAVNKERREQITNNHSATHLLHYALRNILGKHIEQKGSLVNASYFRFDFSHFEKITDDKLREVERMVNRLIRQGIPKEEFRDVPIEQAREMGAMALFGEKYGNSVRVIKFGDSIELCGGTHTENTGKIGYFKILSESAVAAGVRRIEASTGAAAESVIEGYEDMLRNLHALLNNTPNLVASIKKIISENEDYRKKVEEAMKEKAVSIKNKVMEEARSVNGISLMTLKGIYPPDVVKDIAFMLRNETRNSVLIAAYAFEDKPYLALMYTDDLVEKGANAGKDIREAARFINGGGGGQAFFASAGGKNINGLAEAADKLEEIASR